MFKINAVMIFNGVLVAVIAYFLLKALTKDRVNLATGSVKSSFCGFNTPSFFDED